MKFSPYAPALRLLREAVIVRFAGGGGLTYLALALGHASRIPLSRNAKKMFYTTVGIDEVAAFHPHYYQDNSNILIMETSDPVRYQIIQSVMARHQEKDAVDATVDLWERMATQIISVVGENGFHSLYTRSVLLAQAKLPWLAAAALLPQPDARFAELKRSFERQTSAQMEEANMLLIITFTDILAAIIGEQLTVSILRAAWGNDVPDRSAN